MTIIQGRLRRSAAMTQLERELAELMPATEAPHWSELALCQQTDPDAFFPEKGGSTREAKAMCARCEVRAECLAWALANDERYGVWGGLSERERRALKRKEVAA